MAILNTNLELELGAQNSGWSTREASVNRRGGVFIGFRQKLRYMLPFTVGDLISASNRVTKNNTGDMSRTETGVWLDPTEFGGFISYWDANGKCLAKIGNRTIENNYSIIPFVGHPNNVDGTFSASPDVLGNLDFRHSASRFDLRLDFDDTAGTYEVRAYHQGALIYRSDPVDMTLAGVGKPTHVQFGGPDWNDDYVHDNYMFTASDILIGDEPTAFYTPSTLVGTSGGFHGAAAGGFSDVNEPGTDPTTVLRFDQVGMKESWNIIPLTGKTFGSTAVGGIGISVQATASNDSAVKKLRPFVRIADVDYPAAQTFPVGIDASPFTYVFPLNPATGLPWLGSTLDNGVEVGLEALA